MDGLIIEQGEFCWQWYDVKCQSLLSLSLALVPVPSVPVPLPSVSMQVDIGQLVFEEHNEEGPLLPAHVATEHES